MKKIVYLLVVLLLFLSACNTNSNGDNELPKPTKINDNKEMILPDSDKSITMILKNSILNSNDNVMGDYASKLLSEEGYNVEIKFFDFDSRSLSKGTEGYKNFIRDEINTGKNVLFESGFDIEDLVDEGLIYDTQIDKDSFQIEIGRRQRLSYTGVYIDAKLESEYGKAIENTDEYDDFLMWASQNVSDKLPGLIVLDGGIGELYSPLALFAQENGYVRADWSIGSISEGSTALYIETDEIKNAADITPLVHQAIDLPFFYNMDLKLNQWKSNGYIEFKKLSELTVMSDYSSIIMNTHNATEYYSFDYRNTRYRMIDVSDFNLHIFTENGIYSDSPLLTQIGYSSKFAISAKSPSPENVTGFIEWIYNSFDNYMLFMCGKEGIDYDIEDNQISFKVNDVGVTYGLWYKHIAFVDPDMGLIMPHFPANWEEINSAFSQVNGIKIVNVIGEENLPENLTELVYQTVFEGTMQNEYRADVISKYTKYFDEFKKEEPKYLAADLIMDVQNSKAAVKKKEAYEDFIDAIIGN